MEKLAYRELILTGAYDDINFRNNGQLQTNLLTEILLSSQIQFIEILNPLEKNPKI